MTSSDVFVHSHALKHGLTEQQIIFAWNNFVASQPRSAPDEDKVLRIGYDRNGTLIQMVARQADLGVLVSTR